MGAAPPSRAEIFSALAQDLDISAVCRRFGLTREDLAQVFREAAALFDKENAGAWRLFVDGAARGNPGPAGAGAVLFDPSGKKRAQDSRYLGETTNNVAEYQAFILGLELALSLGVKNLHVSADSLLVVQQLKGAYQVKTPHLFPLWRQARKTLQKFDTCAISHLDRSLNQEADRLARQAIDQHQRKR
jgi:ribonuclease HI